ncbi:MAG: selenide, water dikinase SelD [Thermodesulfovibrionales bacterium]
MNDPSAFGSISAANSLSDVYAMGGKPLTALAIIGFSSCDYEPDVIKEILRGAISILDRAGVSLMGGHSFEDPELKFGLSVTGIVDRERILKIRGAKEGDVIVVTKPIGTGIIATALKGGKIKDEDMQPVVKWMLTLNSRASEAALNAGATSATDVTGFGLLGHACNMVKGSSIDFVINHSDVPVLDNVRGLISYGLVPMGAYSNLRFLDDKVDFSSSLSEDERLLLSDPQTSGGLLITIPEGNMERFARTGVPYWRIGKVINGSGRISVI